MFLAGDAGGTKTILSIFTKENNRLTEHKSEKFASAEFGSLEEMIEKFINDLPGKIEKACIGIPGPVFDGKAKSTNIAWEMNENKLSASLRIPKFRLVNDLVATASAIPFFSEDDTYVLYKGEKENRTENYIVLAPGTGLGQSFLHFSKGDYHVISSEGGHVDFAPVTDIEIELYKYLHRKYGRVSYERVVSGLGLINIFDFLKEIDFGDIDESILTRMQDEDKAAVISEAALSHQCKVCEKALDIFASALGAQAGNLVLSFTATGGVYFGGGIPPKILDKLKDGTIVKNFLDKGRLSYMVRATPLYVIKDSSAALHGAAHIASQL